MRRGLLALAVTALLPVISAACGGMVNVEQEKTALLQRDKEWSAATKDTDPTKFLAFFAPDASLYQTGMPVVTGAGALKEMYLKMMATPGMSLGWTATKVDVSASGEIGYTAGAYETSMAGMPPEKGKYITIWKKIDGVWRAMEDIGNADAGPVPSQHAMADPASLVWGEPPPTLPPGSKLAVISGDPSKPGPFVIRAQLPAGYRIAPHWHPGDENVTVLSGTIAMGLGETWDDAKLKTLPAGGYFGTPAETRHFLLSRTAATIQVHGMGPLTLNYVNPADDPSKK